MTAFYYLPEKCYRSTNFDKQNIIGAPKMWNNYDAKK